MTPDPMVQAPYNLQSYNRYTYGFNNPMAGTDPSRYGFFSDLLDSFANFFDKNIETVLPVVVGVAIGGPFGTAIGSYAGAAAGGYLGGYISSDGDPRAALTGAFTAALVHSVSQGSEKWSNGEKWLRMRWCT